MSSHSSKPYSRTSMKPSSSSSSSSSKPDSVKENKLYVGNIDKRLSEFQLISLFKEFGSLKDFHYAWHTQGPKRGQPRGFCFVEYQTRQEAERAEKAMHSKNFYGRDLVVKFMENAQDDLQQGKSSSTMTLDKARQKIAALEHKLNSIKKPATTTATSSASSSSQPEAKSSSSPSSPKS